MSTSVNNIPSARFVDTYFTEGAFYLVTYADTNKVKETAVNPNVFLCSRKGYSFKGNAINMGHPLLPENSKIRELLIAAFHTWYFKHNNESDNICILKICPESGFIYKDGTGYEIDFLHETAKEFPFEFNTVFVDE